VRDAYDVVVIGSGPNGLAAAIVAASRGLSTVVLEARDTIGGGVSSAELTRPGFIHDVCSSVLPMAVASPFFRGLPLASLGVEWITPPAAAAHPLDDGTAVMLYNDQSETARGLGADERAYRRTVGAIAKQWHKLEGDILGPIGFPSHPFSYARFGVQALMPASAYATIAFSTERARALFAGCAAHSIIPLSYPGSTAIAIALMAVGHAHGWPAVRGGSQRLADALAARLRSLGGEIATGVRVTDRKQLPKAERLLFDTAPRTMATVMGDRLPNGFSKRLTSYSHGPAAFKVDWALNAPIPWKARECSDAATVHVGGTLDEIAASESAPWQGEHAERPFVLVTQRSQACSIRLVRQRGSTPHGATATCPTDRPST
jgi:phytoene dehydrogenase-like protein